MMRTVKFTGCSDEQVRWGGNDDPRGVLTEGETYEVEKTEVHSWHTKTKLKGVDGWFNSVCFKAVCAQPPEADT
jgi:hypothetical protein